MKQLAYNINKRFVLLIATIKYTFRTDTAHFSNNWGNILSTCFYTISNIIFIDVLYANVKSVAGYGRDEMLLFMFMGQIAYYLSWTIHSNIDWLIEIVNTGQLDLVLSKPVPSLFYITFGRVRLFSVLRDCIPPMLVLTLVINWQNLNLSGLNVAVGIVICLLGIAAAHCVHFISSLPVFWVGQSSQMIDLSESLEYNVGKVIPYEGFGRKLQFFFTAFVPYLISAGVATSVMLGKTPAIISLFGVLIITTGALLAKGYAWKIALKSYTSASS